MDLQGRMIARLVSSFIGSRSTELGNMSFIIQTVKMSTNYIGSGNFVQFKNVGLLTPSSLFSPILFVSQ